VAGVPGAAGRRTWTARASWGARRRERAKLWQRGEGRRGRGREERRELVERGGEVDGGGRDKMIEHDSRGPQYLRI
jgi:hypothetical protein